MKARNSKKAASIDLHSAVAMKQFKAAAETFTSKATASKKAALDALRKEGIVTATGRLSKRYS